MIWLCRSLISIGIHQLIENDYLMIAADYSAIYLAGVDYSALPYYNGIA